MSAVDLRGGRARRIAANRRLCLRNVLQRFGEQSVHVFLCRRMLREENLSRLGVNK